MLYKSSVKPTSPYILPLTPQISFLTSPSRYETSMDSWIVASREFVHRLQQVFAEKYHLHHKYIFLKLEKDILSSDIRLHRAEIIVMRPASLGGL